MTTNAAAKKCLMTTITRSIADCQGGKVTLTRWLQMNCHPLTASAVPKHSESSTLTSKQLSADWKHINGNARQNAKVAQY